MSCFKRLHKREWTQDFAVSSMAFRGKSLEELSKLACDHGLLIEFSSGIPFQPDLEQSFVKASCRKLVHNYFPAPSDPFVLNLASLDSDNLIRSLDHVKKSIDLSLKSTHSFYSLHAGFCLEPSPRHLGHQMPAFNPSLRSQYWQRFIQSLALVLDWADEKKVNILIENNVLAPFNFQEDLGNPFLCTESVEILKMIETLHHPRLGVLLDTGHWIVSHRSLGLNHRTTLEQIAPYVGAIHHSANNGMEDTNDPIDSSYWFLDEMNLFRDAVHILEVHDQSIEQVRSQLNLLKLICQKGGA